MPRGLREVGDGHDGQGQRSGYGMHRGEAQTQTSGPVEGVLLHPQADPLLDLQRAAAEHQAVLEGVFPPLRQEAPPTQAHHVSHRLRVEAERAEAGPAAPVRAVVWKTIIKIKLGIVMEVRHRDNNKLRGFLHCQCVQKYVFDVLISSDLLIVIHHSCI